MTRFRAAVENDIPRLADIAAMAFLENPLFLYLFGGTANLVKKGSAYFSFVFRGGFRNGYITVAGDPACGFIISVPHSAKLYSLRTELGAGAARLPFTCGPAVIARSLRFERILTALRRQYLPPEHLYVYLLGVLPGFRKQGIGAALLGKAATSALEKGFPVALETMTPELAAYYRKRGFTSTGSRHFPEADLELFGMVKESGSGVNV
ncbi:MAG: GNAT family N-acetyltransferase [Spirochaetales bacterium]|nr:MAG: GNAT family N-acetyltransferase [Spirochaetales bacterium]